MKKIILASLAFAVAAGLLIAANTFNSPPTILHVVVVKWKADSTSSNSRRR